MSDDRVRIKKRILFLVDNFEEIICSLLMVIIVVLVGWSVIGRFVFFRNWSWHEEVIRISFVSMILIGIALAAKKEAHIRISIFISKLPEKMRKWADLLSDTLWFVLNIIVLYACIPMLKSMCTYVTTTAALGIAEYAIYMIVPLSLLLTSFRIIQVYIRRYKQNGSIFPALIDGEVK
jgi:TRAP-type C4-dicarboxylate transport system permease small subunit